MPGPTAALHARHARRPVIVSTRPPHAQQFVEDEQRRADADRAVGDVERREVPAAVVDLDEVDDVAAQQPVDHVADRTAEDERERPAEQPLPAMTAQHPDDEAGGEDAEADEEPALPAGAPARNENAAPVLCTRTRLKNEVTVRLSPSSKKPMISAFVNWSSRITASAIASQGQNGGGGRPGLARRHQAKVRVSPAPCRLLVQRPHSAGCAASWPTSSR